MKEIIGIIGLGDLGGRLAMQITGSGFDVVAFDTQPVELANLGLAVDPNLAVTRNDKLRVEIVHSMDEVLRRSSVVHWAVPSSQLVELPSSGLRHDTLVMLHDSVMHNSERALFSRVDAGKFCIVHCLVNHKRRVLVAGHNDRASAHFSSIGLEPKSILSHEHDRLLAHSQGILATLVDMGVKAELEQAFRSGNLTPSGEELHDLLKHRELNWTKNTLHSILQNPALKELKDSMR